MSKKSLKYIFFVTGLFFLYLLTVGKGFIDLRDKLTFSVFSESTNIMNGASTLLEFSPNEESYNPNLFSNELNHIDDYQACLQPASIENVFFQNNLNYFRGASITIMFTPNGNFNLDNTFHLELSDSDGNFLASPTLLSSKNEFFIPVLNGTIPTSSFPSTEYRLRIRSTSPEVIYVSEKFRISENTSSIANSIPSLNEGSSIFTTDSFIKCVGQDNNFFGFLQGGALFSSIPLSLTNFTSNSTTARVYSGEGIWQEARSLNVQGPGQFSIPGPTNSTNPVNWAQGYYPILITKTVNGQSMTFGLVFLNNTGNTGLANTSDETVCVGSPVNFVVDTQVMSKNYPGSKYSINFGDGTNELEFTHSQLMSCPQLTHVFNLVTCSSGLKAVGPKIPGFEESAFYFRTDLKLFNKGLIEVIELIGVKQLDSKLIKVLI
jgi:hypothetical protein